MRKISIEDLDNTDVSVLNAIKPDTWGSIEEIHAHYLKTSCAGCVKAVNGDHELLGIGTGLRYGATGWLAHIIVSPHHRREGIGIRIVEDRIRFLTESCACRTITLTATDEGYPLYKKVGFAEQSMYVILSRPQDRTMNVVADPKIRMAQPGQFDEMLNIDRIASGENREALLRATLAGSYAYVNDGAVEGFYLPGFGDGGVMARTEGAGLALLGERIKKCAHIYIPEENTVARDFLTANGYTEVRRIHRMILGEPFPRNPEYCYSRVGGFAG